MQILCSSGQGVLTVLERLCAQLVEGVFRVNLL